MSASDAAQAEDSAPESVDTIVEAGETRTDMSMPERSLGPGTRIGRYLALEELGRGGMGVVFSAYDPELDRRVALKLLHRRFALNADSTGGTSHLLREAQALAQVSHPNVVHVYDVGLHDSRLWMAMEFIEGASLRKWVGKHKPSWRAVLDLCIQAGRGLVAAHAAGIVHRDFKPDNVVIGNDGRVVVLDFGLAEARPGAASVRTPGGVNSRTSSAVGGTPLYMAPEQHDGLPPDAACDQFAFCVSVHEAVFGIRPFAGSNLKELRAQIVDQQFASIGRADAPSWVRKALLRGLANAPSDRWPTLEALLTELERDPAKRRVRGVAAVGLVALAGVAVYGLARDPAAAAPVCVAGSEELAAIWDDAARQRMDAAFRATGKTFAEAAFQNTAGVFDAYGQAWVEMRNDACAATHVRKTQSQDVLDIRMACLDRGLGELRALTTLLEQADGALVERSVTAAFGLSDIRGCADVEALGSSEPLPDDPATRQEVAALRDRLARTVTLIHAGRYDDGVAATTEMVGLAERLGFAPVLAEINAARALALDLSGAKQEARAAYLDAVVEAERGGHDHVAATAYIGLLQLVATLPDLAAQAVEWERHAEALVDRLGRGTALEADLLLARADLASNQSRFEDSLRLNERSLELRQSLVGEERLEVAKARRAVGRSLIGHGRYPEALAQYQAATEIARRIVGPTHPETGSGINGVALAYDWLGDQSKASDHYRQTIEIWEAALGRDHPDVAIPYNNLAGVYYAIGDDRALGAFQRALEIWEKAYGADHADVALTLGNIGLVLEGMERMDEALANHERALATRIRVFGPEHVETSTSYLNIGDHMTARERYAEARVQVEHALAIRIAAHGDAHPEVARVYESLADLEEGDGNLEKALAAHERELSIFEAALGPDHENTGLAHKNVGLVQIAMGRNEIAKTHLESALGVMQRDNPADWNLAAPRFGLARARWALGDRGPETVALAQAALRGQEDPANADEDAAAEIRTWLQEHVAER